MYLMSLNGLIDTSADKNEIIGGYFYRLMFPKIQGLIFSKVKNQ